ncbi:hypothetical protein [Methylobacterium frigidaeris]|uniref:hypothetical protein n=1 Tax=Methylobacterium frigidaeris TaxID=2038277 RepID=UPI001EE04602|nr:hypothetical protein [Methylobacterium frigidaeris]
MRSSLTIPEFTRALSGRIASLARTHALITEDVAQAASFGGCCGRSSIRTTNAGACRWTAQRSCCRLNSPCRLAWRCTS